MIGKNNSAISEVITPRFLMRDKRSDSFITPKPISGGNIIEYMKTYGPLMINNPPINNVMAIALSVTASSSRLLSLELLKNNTPA